MHALNICLNQTNVLYEDIIFDFHKMGQGIGKWDLSKSQKKGFQILMNTGCVWEKGYWALGQWQNPKAASLWIASARLVTLRTSFRFASLRCFASRPAFGNLFISVSPCVILFCQHLYCYVLYVELIAPPKQVACIKMQQPVDYCISIS